MRATLGRADRTSTPVDGRTRKRFAAMRRVQDAALDLFEARGFHGVTIEEIAAAADVGPATVYRNFGTKERIVLWDDYDAPLFEAIRTRLSVRSVAPATAVLEGVIDALAPIYQRDRDRLLRRTRMAHEIPEVRAATASDLQQLRLALAEQLMQTRSARTAITAQVQAAAFVGALEVALAHWSRGDTATSLAAMLRKAFAALPGPPA